MRSRFELGNEKYEEVTVTQKLAGKYLLAFSQFGWDTRFNWYPKQPHNGCTIKKCGRGKKIIELAPSYKADCDSNYRIYR